MKRSLFLPASPAALAFILLAPLGAQTEPVADPAPQMLAVALQFRSDLVNAVTAGSETPSAALTRLHGSDRITGLALEPDIDFAYGAIDVGQRLVAASRPESAESFFRAAEESLAAVVQRTPDERPADKAQYLVKLALVRGEYLNEAAQAARDLDRAIALQPEDAFLRRAKAVWARAHAAAVAAAATQAEAQP